MQRDEFSAYVQARWPALVRTAVLLTGAGGLTLTRHALNGLLTGDSLSNVAGNWSPNAIPGARDTAIIASSGTYTVTLDSGVFVGGLTLGGIAGVQTLAMNNQLLQLGGPFTVNAHGSYTLANGTLAGVSNAILSGTFHWAAGGFHCDQAEQS